MCAFELGRDPDWIGPEAPRHSRIRNPGFESSCLEFPFWTPQSDTVLTQTPSIDPASLRCPPPGSSAHHHLGRKRNCLTDSWLQ